MKLALAPFGVSPPPNFKSFITRIERLAAEAALGGADLLALPEYFSMVLAGASVTTPDLAAELAVVIAQADELVAALRETAARHKIYLLAGSIPMRTGTVINNRAAFIAPSGALAFQDKQCMTRFEAECWGISGGNPPQVFETSFGRIGPGNSGGQAHPHPQLHRPPRRLQPRAPVRARPRHRKPVLHRRHPAHRPGALVRLD